MSNHIRKIKNTERAPRENRNYTRWLHRQLSTKGKSTEKEACSRTYYFKKKERRRERLGEAQRNLDDAQATSETERKLDHVLAGRPRYIMDKMWQIMQSKDTKTLNLDKDFEEMMDKVKHAEWNESTKTKRFWTQDEDEDQ